MIIYDESQLKNTKCEKIDVECNFCRKHFQCERRLVQRALRAKKDKFCSIDCSSLAKKKERIEMICDYCKLTYKRLINTEKKVNRNSYCSHTCRAKHQNIIREEEKIKYGTATNFVCRECGISKRCEPRLASLRKFCSIACREKHNYKKYKNIYNIASEMFKQCPSCNKNYQIYNPSDFEKRKYCSAVCRNKENNKNNTRLRSKAEYILEYELKRYFPDEYIMFNDRGILDGLELDVFFPNLNLAIEWNGIYHYVKIRDEKTFSRIQTTDAKKLEKCSEKGIDILVIKDLKSHKKFIKEKIDEIIEYIKTKQKSI